MARLREVEWADADVVEEEADEEEARVEVEDIAEVIKAEDLEAARDGGRSEGHDDRRGNGHGDRRQGGRDGGRGGFRGRSKRWR